MRTAIRMTVFTPTPITAPRQTTADNETAPSKVIVGKTLRTAFSATVPLHRWVSRRLRVIEREERTATGQNPRPTRVGGDAAFYPRPDPAKSPERMADEGLPGAYRKSPVPHVEIDSTLSAKKGKSCAPSSRERSREPDRAPNISVFFEVAEHGHHHKERQRSCGHIGD